MSKRVYFILWEETEDYDLQQVYIGGGEHKVIGKKRDITKRVRWSDEITSARKQQALDYISGNMADDYRRNVRLKLLTVDEG